MTVLAHGEDRSSYQKVGPWTGLQFGFFKLTEALDFVDGAAQQNYENLLRAGVVPAAYHFLHPNISAIEQAQFFLSTAERLGMTAQLGFACDSEILVTSTGRLQMASFSAGRSHLLELGANGQIQGRQGASYPDSYLSTAPVSTNQATSEFMDEISRLQPWHHRELYTTISIGDTLTECGQYPLWLAYPALSIPRLPAPWEHWTFWQFAWTGGYANSDRDVFNGDARQLADWVSSFASHPVPEKDIVHWRSREERSLDREAQVHHTTPEAMLRCAAEAGHHYGPAMREYIARHDWTARLPHFTELYAPK
jgi:GH25 family lysozyme M1 (1,4-beta-N-acetylmuramidase)